MDNKLGIMISFIIIGRNEEKNIKRCIESIYRAIEAAKIATFEIIYVDADSTDRSIEFAHSYADVKVYKVLGGRNAAVGRDIGAKEATGNVLFFVDGDMEVYEQFMVNVWNPKTLNIKESYVAGIRCDIVSDERLYPKMSKRFSGGSFLIKSKIWNEVGGMRTRFRAGEESDLGLRLMQKGIYFVRRKELMIDHYTVPYLSQTRMWNLIWTKYIFHSRCVLYRNHLLNKHMYRLLWTIDKTFLLLIVAILSIIIFLPVGLIMFLLYLIMVIMRIRKNKIYLPFVEMIAYYFVSDTLNIIYFFTFFPKDIKLEYVPVPRP